MPRVATFYRRQPPGIDAVKWDGKPRTAEMIAGWSKGRVVVDRAGDERNLVVFRADGRVTIEPGQWVVEVEAGVFSCMTHEAFVERYEPA